MSTSLLISFPDDMPSVIIRQDFLWICTDAPNSSCAAAILQYFNFSMSNKKHSNKSNKTHNDIEEKETGTRSQDESLWTYKTIMELKDEELLGTWGRGAVMDNLNWLVDNELLLRRNNPKFAYDKTYQYQVNVEPVRMLVEEWKIQNRTCESPKLNFGKSKTEPAIPYTPSYTPISNSFNKLNELHSLFEIMENEPEQYNDVLSSELYEKLMELGIIEPVEDRTLPAPEKFTLTRMGDDVAAYATPDAPRAVFKIRQFVISSVMNIQMDAPEQITDKVAIAGVWMYRLNSGEWFPEFMLEKAEKPKKEPDSEFKPMVSAVAKHIFQLDNPSEGSLGQIRRLASKIRKSYPALKADTLQNFVKWYHNKYGDDIIVPRSEIKIFPHLDTWQQEREKTQKEIKATGGFMRRV